MILHQVRVCTLSLRSRALRITQLLDHGSNTLLKNQLEVCHHAETLSSQYSVLQAFFLGWLVFLMQISLQIKTCQSIVVASSCSPMCMMCWTLEVVC